MTKSEKQAAYLIHVRREVGVHLHPNGCFYCGGNHASIDCPDEEAVKEFWKEDEAE